MKTKETLETIKKYIDTMDEAIISNVKIETKRINNINELISINGLQVGDIVDLQGYYEAGDGAHHKRKIESADDGSGVQLTNGLWANIVHNGEVNVSWFGAKGDGVTDDTLAVQKSAKTNANIKFEQKTYIASGQLDFRMNRRVFGNRARIIFEKKTSDNYDCVLVMSSTIFEDMDLIISGNNDGVLLHYNELEFVESRSYPSQTVIRNLYLDSNNADKVGTLIKFSPNRNYGAVFDNIRMGRGRSQYSRRVKNGFIGDFTLATNGWSTGNIFRDITMDLFVSDYHMKFEGGSIAGGGSSNIFENIQLQMREGVENSFKCALKLSRMNVARFVNFKLWDYKNNCTTGKPIQLDNCSNLQTINSDITNYESDLVANLSNNFNSFKYNGETIPFSQKTNADKTKAVPIFLKTNGQIGYAVPSLELIPNRDFANDTRVGYLKVFGRAGDFAGANNGFFLTYITSDNKAFLKKIKLYKEGIVVWVKDCVGAIKNISLHVENSVVGSTLTNIDGSTEVITEEVFENAVTTNIEGIKFFNTKIDESYNSVVYTDKLDTPYYALKMQQENVYEDFVAYMDEKLEYDKEQRYLEEQRQLAFESREDQEQTYEDWLSSQPQLMPVVEPQPSQALLDFKKKYLG